MASTKSLWIAGGLLAAGVLSLPGCGTTRPETHASRGWSSILFPWRSLAADSEIPAESPEPPPFDPSLRSSAPESVATDPSEYYQPRSDGARSRQPIVPPPVPPASEPGYFESELESSGNAAQSTSRPLSPTPTPGEPSRLRDLFDSVRRRRPAPPVQRIPLDGPVADGQDRRSARTVGFDVPEPVTLGQPEFDD